MNRLLLFSVLLLGCIQYAAAQRKIVCYYTNWSQYRPEGAKYFPENIDPFLCTHIIYAFAKLTNHELAAYEWNDETPEWGGLGLYDRTHELKKKNPNLKVLLAVGGWNMGSTDFSNMVTNPSLRSNFVAKSVTFLQKNKFDGLDLDWEYPSTFQGSRPSDKQLFTTLIRELKAAFAPHGFLLTAAVAAGVSTIDNAYEVANIASELDFINLMAYDLHGSWETFTGHHSGLYGRADETGDQKFLNVDYAARYWIRQGTPKQKLILGLATYGRTFRLASQSQFNLGAPATGPGSAGTYTREAGFLAYYEVCQRLQQGWTRVYNAEQRVPYAFSGSEWVGYEDVQSLSEKVQYIKDEGYGGAMFWALDLDDFEGRFCNQGNYPLMNLVKSQLNNGDSTPYVTLPTNPTPTGIVTSTGNIQTTTGNIQTSTGSSSGNKCPNGNGFYADKESGCEKYYQCIFSGTAFQTVQYYTCPVGTLFDVSHSVCNYANEVVC